MRHWTAAVTVACTVIVLTAAAARPALAQGAAGQAPPAPRPTVWELEGLGGVSLGRFSSGGSASLPAPGPPITTSSPIYPSWSVPSWFFGDGAQFINNVSEQFGLAARITPLDAALTSLGLNDAGGVHVGARVRRHVAARYGIELGVDVMASGMTFSDSLLDAASTTRASFETTFGAVLGTGPFTSPVVTSSASTSGGSSREVAVTAALTWEPGRFSGVVPFVIAGGGVILETGDLPALDLTGTYRFSISGAVPVQETDRVTLRYVQKAAPVLVVGGGVRRDFSTRWGLRVDGRVLLGSNPTVLQLDAHPAITTGTPAGFIESFTYPNLQFSNNASTGRRSTLGAPAVEAFEAFDGGWQTRVRIGIGVYLKF